MYEGLIGQYVLVGHGTYSLRAGILDAVDGTTVRLKDSRQVFYFAAQPKKNGVQGVDALLTHGPAKGSKIGPVTPLGVVNNVHRVSLCTPAAEAAFMAAGWAE